MKKRMHQFLTALLWLFGFEEREEEAGKKAALASAGAAGFKTRRSRPGIEMKELYNLKYDSATMSQQQCMLLIQAVSRILREEAEKKDLSFSLEVKPKSKGV